MLSFSAGGDGLEPISCMGCHGRAEDVTPVSNYGAGLRQHHFNAGETVCLDCHDDADPRNYTPVGEDVLPPYYYLPLGTHVNKPTDPCNPNGEEDYEGSLNGLDNDGDLAYDTADADCSPPPPPECTVDADCDDGVFCNGAETCDGSGTCQSGAAPCAAGDTCDETANVCVAPPPPPECTVDADCDDGVFCNGAETCDGSGTCQSGAAPCAAGDTCDETANVCVAPSDCTVDETCDDDHEEDGTKNTKRRGRDEENRQRGRRRLTER